MLIRKVLSDAINSKSQLNEQEVAKSLRMHLYDGMTSEALLCLSTGAILVAIALSMGASNIGCFSYIN